MYQGTIYCVIPLHHPPHSAGTESNRGLRLPKQFCVMLIVPYYVIYYTSIFNSHTPLHGGSKRPAAWAVWGSHPCLLCDGGGGRIRTDAYVVLETTALPLGYSPIMLSAKDCFVKTQPIQFNNGMVGVFSIVSGRFKN